jgi:DNA modification methylase
MNKQTTDIKISDIHVSDRFRKDHGDLKELAQSIAELGLLQPIGVTPDNRLVFGERRLKAVRDILGWETIPVLVIDIDSMLHGQYAENEHRKDFTISERVAIVNALRSYSHGGDRKSDQVRNGDNDSLTLAEAREKVGFGKDSFYRAEDVVERGIPELVDAMDSGKLSINAAHKLAQAESDEQEECLQIDFNGKKPTAHSVEKSLHEIRRRRDRKITSLPLGPLSINEAHVGDCRNLIPNLSDNSISLGVTSPPYADQRKGMYPGVPENEYPDFTVDWMGKVWDKLTDDGSVMIVIRPHLKNGVISDYVLRTRLALREFGWKECEELIWFKPDGGNATGSNRRPRRSFEHILWFSKTHDPYIDTKACGGWTDRLAFFGKNRFGLGPNKPFHSGQSNEKKSGRSRSADVIHMPVANVTKGLMHPAMFPIPLAEHLIKTFCPEGDTVLDPFAGSGSTLIAAKQLGRQFYGFDIMPEYVEIARQRLATFNEVTEVRDFDYFRQELRMLLEDCLELGGPQSKQHVLNCFKIIQSSQAVDFEITLASMPPKLREFYESLPLTLAA